MLHGSCWIVISIKYYSKTAISHVYVPPIHVDLVHFLCTWGAYVPHLHGDQHISTWHLHVFAQHCHVVQRTYRLYTKFHQAWQAIQNCTNNVNLKIHDRSFWWHQNQVYRWNRFWAICNLVNILSEINRRELYISGYAFLTLGMCVSHLKEMLHGFLRSSSEMKANGRPDERTDIRGDTIMTPVPSRGDSEREGYILGERGRFWEGCISFRKGGVYFGKEG